MTAAGPPPVRRARTLIPPRIRAIFGAVIATALLAAYAVAPLQGAASRTPVPCRGACWRPTVGTTWNWVLAAPPHAPFRHVRMYDVDGFDASTGTVTALHRSGIRVVCYLSAGTWESWRPDAGRYPRSALGRPDSGWPGERWIDIRAAIPGRPLFTVLARRVAMCAAKHFDAVEFDNVDGYVNVTGFPLTGAQQLRFDRMLADMAHRAGLSVLLKNDLGQVRQLMPWFDGALNEQCNQYAECGLLRPFVRARKPVFNAEYRSGARFCAADRRAGFDGLGLDVALDGRVFVPCAPPVARSPSAIRRTRCAAAPRPPSGRPADPARCPARRTAARSA